MRGIDGYTQGVHDFNKIKGKCLKCPNHAVCSEKASEWKIASREAIKHKYAEVQEQEV